MPRLQVGYVWHERGNKTEVVLQQRFEAMINPFRGPVSIIMHTKDDEDKEFRLNMEDKVQQKEMPNKRRPARQTRRSAAEKKKLEKEKKEAEAKAAKEAKEKGAAGKGLLSEVAADVKARSKIVNVEKGRAAKKKQDEAKAAKAEAAKAAKAAKQEAAAKAKEARAAKSSSCPACNGMHRAHTCEKATAYDKDGKEDLAPGEYKPVPYGNSPVTWMQLDPNFMWPPACFSFRQSWSNWINQLRCERNVVAQWAAVVALGEQHGDTLNAVSGLADALEDDRLFYGVRQKIAQTLATQCATAHPGTPVGDQASHKLLFYFKSRWYGKGLVDPRPNDFSDFGAYFVQKAMVRVNAGLRDAADTTPEEQIERLRELLQWNNNEANPYDDAEYLSCVVGAVLLTRVTAPAQRRALGLLREEVLRYLNRELLYPTPRNIVGASCVNALSHIDTMIGAMGDEVAEPAAPEAMEVETPRTLAAGAPLERVDVSLYYGCLHAAHSEAVRTQAVIAVARFCSAGLWRQPPERGGTADSEAGCAGAADGIELLLEICERTDECEAVRLQVVEALRGVNDRTLAPTAEASAEGPRLLRSAGVLGRLGWILNEGSALSAPLREGAYQLLTALAQEEGALERQIAEQR